MHIIPLQVEIFIEEAFFKILMKNNSGFVINVKNVVKYSNVSWGGVVVSIR